MRTFTRFRVGALAAVCLLLAGVMCGTEKLEAVTLQLKWKHQFQFAGYYAAVAKGYYREAGLEVMLVEAKPGRDPVEEVLAGRAEFGVGTSELLLLRGRGQPVVVLAAIYQHSPLVLMARQTPTITDLQALHDQPIMIEPQSAELFAYFKNEGVDPARLRIEHHTFDVQALIEGKVAAMSAYSSDEPYLLKQADVNYLTFTPRAGGIDFYGDNLFTTEAQIARNPELVKKFREASLRGWDYALAHPREIVELIHREYSQRKSIGHLTFEADQTVQLMHPAVIEVGHMNPGRWRHIADTYAEFGMLPVDFDLTGFIYEVNPPPDVRWVKWTVATMGVLVVAGFGWALPLWRLNRKLRAAKEAAEEANAAKGRYLAFLTHEIRTPLNGVAGTINSLKSEADPRLREQQITALEQSTRNLLELVSNVLDHSQIEAGRMSVELAPLVLREFTQGLIDAYRGTAKMKGVRLEAVIDAQVPGVVRTDALRLRQILSNLLANALKFTVHGEVVLRVRAAAVADQSGCRLIFSVKDTGVGIARDKLATIFEPYGQTDASMARRFGGTGLGLAISQQLAQLLGGAIRVESIEGHGSTFTLEIFTELVSGG